MLVPVTTKPYLNSVNFCVLHRASLHFFLLIKEKINKHITYCLRDCSTYKLQCILVSKAWITDPASLPTTLAGLFLFRFELHLIRSQRESRSLRFGDNSTNASNLQWPSGHSLRSFLASLIKEDFYNGKSSGI